MAGINFAGRIPVITKTISGRLVWTGVLVALLLIGAVVFGFHFRMKKQEAQKQQQQTTAVASDAAQSNRGQVEGSAALSGLPVTPTQSSPSVVTTPTPGNMPSTTPQLQPNTMYYPMQTMPSATAASAYSRPAPAPINREQQLLQRRREREQQAIDGQTGLQEQRTNAASVSDPQQSELSQLRALIQPSLSGQSSGQPIVYQQPAGGVPGGVENEGGQGYHSQNGQAEKRQFQEGGEGPGDDYLKTIRTQPLSRWVVQRGTVIPATLPHTLVSDLPGDLIAEVARDVYDSPTQKFVEIPAGSRLVGEYNSSVSYGQNRVQVIWIAIYFPDGSFIDLDRMPSHSADGSTGLKDQVDNHWTRTIAGVALSSLLSAGLQISQNRSNGSNSVLNYPSTGQVAASAIGTQAAQLGQQLTNRNLNVQPTLKIRPGEIFAVSVKKDILFQGPYQPMEVQ